MTDSEQEFSDDHEITWEEARIYELRFGLHKGKSLEWMILTKKRRDLLKYYVA